MTDRIPETVPVIADLGELVDRFDGFLVDQWGVLHDGTELYPRVAETLGRLTEAGKRVVVLTNSGKRAAASEVLLAGMGLPREAYTGIMSSGEAAWRLLSGEEPGLARPGLRCLLIARGGDTGILEGLDLASVDRPEEADVVLLAGLDHDAEAVDGAWAKLECALDRGLPLICANPDVVGVTRGGFVVSPGQLAERYRGAGGSVRMIGKPEPEIYRHAAQLLGPMPSARVLAVGDSLHHDILGGRRAGYSTLLITQGIHREALKPLGGLSERAVARLCRQEGIAADYAAASLVWKT